MTIKPLILKEIRRVAASQNVTLTPLTDNLVLGESGLDSLCFAILIAQLQELTGRDPLGENESTPFPRTIGDFIALYEHVAAV